MVTGRRVWGPMRCSMKFGDGQSWLQKKLVDGRGWMLEIHLIFPRTVLTALHESSLSSTCVSWSAEYLYFVIRLALTHDSVGIDGWWKRPSERYVNEKFAPFLESTRLFLFSKFALTRLRWWLTRCSTEWGSYKHLRRKNAVPELQSGTGISLESTGLCKNETDSTSHQDSKTR